MEIIERPAPPTGLRRLLFRLPIHFYRLHLGGLLGGRFLLLQHIGRTSGRPRQVVFEVIEHKPAEASYVVCSGYGERADWYRNLVKSPDVVIQIGRRSCEVTGRPLEPAEGGELMARYAPRHPKAAARLVRFMGFAVDGSEEDYRRVGHELPFICFRPRS